MCVCLEGGGSIGGGRKGTEIFFLPKVSTDPFQCRSPVAHDQWVKC